MTPNPNTIDRFHTMCEMDKLYEHCAKFIKDNNITCPEAVWQTDRVFDNAYDFIAGVCEILGYAKEA